MSADKRTGWLGQLKVGDKVIVDGGGVTRQQWIGTVEKVTPTGRMTVSGEAYDHWGRRRLDDWRSYHLLPWTEETELEIRTAYREARELTVVRGVEWRKVAAPTVSKVLAILREDGVIEREELKG